MASIGTKIKEAATKAAKDKVSGDKKGKNDERTGGSESSWTRPRGPSRTV